VNPFLGSRKREPYSLRRRINLIKGACSQDRKKEEKEVVNDDTSLLAQDRGVSLGQLHTVKTKKTSKGLR